jgi:hypothetical protein
MAGGGSREELLRLARAFREAPLARTLTVVDAIINTQKEADLCYHVGQLDVGVCINIESFLRCADRFLSDTTRAVDLEFSRLGGDEAELEEIEKAIGDQIGNLRGTISKLAGGTP